MLNKIKTFIKALFFHIGCGMPKSTQEEINNRWLICCGCEFFENDNKQSKCLQCGCNLSTEKKFLNKLAWADQKCPINRW